MPFADKADQPVELSDEENLVTVEEGVDMAEGRLLHKYRIEKLLVVDDAIAVLLS